MPRQSSRPAAEVELLWLPADHACAPCPVRSRTFCRLLGPAALAAFRSMGTTARLGPGQSLFHEGDPAHLVYTLIAGMLKLYRLLPDGRRQVTGFLSAGGFLGIALDDEHAFSAEAVEAIQFCRLPRTRFEAFIARHPAVERELYLIAAHELAAAQEQMVLLGRKTAVERLASFLLALSRGSNRLRLPMSRADIADYLGLTKETVSRTFTLLRTQRIVALLPHDRVEIVGRHRLEELASGYA